MAFYCVNGSGECSGCGGCEPEPVLYDYQNAPIYNGEDYYDFDGEIVSENSLYDWLKQFVRTAEKEERGW